MVNQKYPNIVSKVEYTPDPEVKKKKFLLQAFYLTPQNYMFSIAVGDKSGLPILNTPEISYY